MPVDNDLTAARAAPLVLSAVANSDSHGYAIIKQVRRLSGGQLEWPDAMFYPLLHRLLRMGYLSSEWRSVARGSQRKCYAITDAGRAVLARQQVGSAAIPGDRLAAIASTPVVRPRVVHRNRFASLRRRVALVGAVSLVVAAVTVTPSGRSAIAEVLDAFRGQSLQIVTVDTADWAGSFNPDDVLALESIGDLDASGIARPAVVADIPEAEALAGIAAPTLVEPPDHLVALAPGVMRLVLVARPENGVPATLDGAVLVVEVPGAIGALYGTQDGAPQVAVGRSGLLEIRSEGAPLDEIRSFLLSREELPEDLRAQLALIGDWRSTLPVPVPVDGPGWEEVEVAGRPAIAFGDNSGIGALVIRQDPEGVTVVVGRVGVNAALELAAGA
jgi:PadR family transcriptional regulator, regulatory protein PadR